VPTENQILVVGRMVGRKLLTPLEIRKITEVGRHAVGKGLYLQVSKWNTRAWVYRYQIAGRRTEMGLGSCDTVTLAKARVLAKGYGELIKEGTDPKIKRDAAIAENITKQIWTFDKCAEAYIEAHSPSWKNAKHGQQWRNTLKQYASPVIGSLPVREINTASIMRVIDPIWLTKTETASRVRGRIERILSWSIVNGYREHPNPAIWRGNISELLPKPSEVSEEQHHAALPYKEAALFMQELSNRKTITAKALAFTILTASRTKEVIEASWDEIDLKEKVWTIPKGRMKSKRVHRVALTDDLIKLLESLPRLSGWLFPSPRAGKHISNMAMLKLLKEGMNRPDLTVHGFRSTFRDWAAEVSPYPRELAEAALAHVLGDKTEAAYQRGDLLEKRREMMLAYSAFVHSSSDRVVSIAKGKSGSRS
jgi:integrase